MRKANRGLLEQKRQVRIKQEKVIEIYEGNNLINVKKLYDYIVEPDWRIMVPGK